MPNLGAAMQRRKHFAGIEAVRRIEGAFDAHLLLQIRLVEHLAHQIALLDADAMLARQHAADRNAEAQNVEADLLGALDLALVRGVVEDQRMQIAVAGMKDIGDLQAFAFARSRPCRRAPRAGARAGSCRPCRDNRADAGDRRKGVLAPGPELQTLGLAVSKSSSSSRLPRARCVSTTPTRRSTSACVPSSSTMTSASASIG